MSADMKGWVCPKCGTEWAEEPDLDEDNRCPGCVSAGYGSDHPRGDTEQMRQASEARSAEEA